MEVSGRKKSPSTDTKQLSEPCENLSKRSPAGGCCVECREYFCQGCTNVHRESKTGRMFVFIISILKTVCEIFKAFRGEIAGEEEITPRIIMPEKQDKESDLTTELANSTLKGNSSETKQTPKTKKRKRSKSKDSVQSNSTDAKTNLKDGADWRKSKMSEVKRQKLSNEDENLQTPELSNDGTDTRKRKSSRSKKKQRKWKKLQGQPPQIKQINSDKLIQIPAADSTNQTFRSGSNELELIQGPTDSIQRRRFLRPPLAKDNIPEVGIPNNLMNNGETVWKSKNPHWKGCHQKGFGFKNKDLSHKMIERNTNISFKRNRYNKHTLSKTKRYGNTLIEELTKSIQTNIINIIMVFAIPYYTSNMTQPVSSADNVAQHPLHASTRENITHSGTLGATETSTATNTPPSNDILEDMGRSSSRTVTGASHIDLPMPCLPTAQGRCTCITPISSQTDMHVQASSNGGPSHPRSSNGNVASSGAPVNLQEELTRMKRCVVCLEHDRNVAFIPCGHFVCCKQCYHRFGNCPICREEIKQKLDIYMS